MADPNVNANAQSVSDKLDGEVDGKPLPYDLIDMLQLAELFSLSGTTGGVTPVKYPEGENVSSSFIDHVNTLTKIFARVHKSIVDGKVYDPWDAIMDTHDSLQALSSQVAALTAAVKALKAAPAAGA